MKYNILYIIQNIKLLYTNNNNIVLVFLFNLKATY